MSTTRTDQSRFIALARPDPSNTERASGLPKFLNASLPIHDGNFQPLDLLRARRQGLIGEDRVNTALRR
jgi:hypothetical protein